MADAGAGVAMHKTGISAWLRPLFLIITLVFMLSAVNALSYPSKDRETRKTKILRGAAFKNNSDEFRRTNTGAILPYAEEGWIDNYESPTVRWKEPKAPAFYRRPDFFIALGVTLILSLIGVMLYFKNRESF